MDTPQGYLLYVVQVYGRREDDPQEGNQMSPIMHVIGWTGNSPVTAEEGLLSRGMGKLVYGVTREQASKAAHEVPSFTRTTKNTFGVV